MKRAAIGVRMHSGWGVVAAVSGDANLIETAARKRIVVMDPRIPGAKQPYHYAAELEIGEADSYLGDCAAASERLATAAIEELVQKLKARGYQVMGCAVLLAAGRGLPSLAKILASHPLLHTAEGEFFRDAVRRACEKLKIPVTRIRERDLDEQATAAYGAAASKVRSTIASMGRSIGPPWTMDHKAAALAALLILSQTKQDIS